MNEQEQFWAGEQGSLYIGRNSGADISARVAFWNRVFAWDEPGAPQSIIELGANIGLNLQAIRSIHTALDLTPPELFAVEINDAACKHLGAAGISYIQCSLLSPALMQLNLAELVATVGVLIHVAPDDLPDAYDVIDRHASRYVLLAEYYAPHPREIAYRGETQRCWARDFCSEFMKRHEGKYKLVDYGFWYHGDPVHPLDDVTHFLMERVT